MSEQQRSNKFTGVRRNGMWFDALLNGRLLGRSVSEEIAKQILLDVQTKGFTEVESNV